MAVSASWTTSCRSAIAVLHFVLIAVCQRFDVVEGANPGLQFRLSKSGLNYGAGVAVDVLAKRAGQLTIPDMHGSAGTPVGKVSYDVTQIHVTNFVKPGTGVVINTGSGLTWQLQNAGISVNGNWHYKYTLGFIVIQDSGSFDGQVSGASLSASVTLGKDDTGHFTISSTGCQCQINNVDIQLHGGASWLYNLFIGFVESPLRNSLQDQICTITRKTIDENARAQLATLPITIVIDNDWVFDYRLVSPPAFQSEYLDSFHKGELFFKGDTTEAPFEASTFSLTPPEQMVTIWVSDYVLNTAGYVLYKHNILRYNLTRNDLPESQRGVLNTTCTSLECFGVLVPQAATAYPNASVEMEMYTSTYPTAGISTSDIQGNFAGNINFRARLSNGSLVPMFKVNVSAAISFVISLQDMVLRGNITNLSSKIHVIESDIGYISDLVLNAAFNLITKIFVIPKLNEVGQKGIPIPMIKDVKLLNTKLEAGNHCLRISTDVSYSPSTKLRFQPRKFT